MDLTFDSGLVWWITAVELPLLGGLLAWLMRRDAGLARRCESRYEELSESMSEQGSRLAHFRLEVASGYATQVSLRESESRLSRHLFRIEGKLDDLLMSRLEAREK
ncbi:MAG: hypothetical protein MPK62_09605 [Alphaproteobacteria bacterium]|nr:hypothetical protein [Alphaproteobacteria bacterium]